jgi:geranylgeranyl reductase family protein
MRSPDLDVICVGAGPAGSLVSYLLARRGLSVLLIERATWPRVKTCGGGLTPRALACLPFDIEPVVERRIEQVRLAFGDHGRVDMRAVGLGATVVRAAFDAFLAKRAVEAGVGLRVATPLQSLELCANGVTVHTAGGSHRARLLIGADGANSVVRRLLFPRHRAAFAFGLEADYQPLSSERDQRGAAEPRVLLAFAGQGGGYGWVFPKRDHFNVGVYRLNKPAQAGGLHAALAGFAAATPELAGCIAGRAVGHPIPVSTGAQPVARGRAILIGDAAGLAEAFFGEGISFALESARIAADWAAGWLRHERGDAATGFGNALRPLVRDLHWSKAMANARHRVPTRWMARAAGVQAVRDATLALLAGHASYRRSFWTMPTLLPAALLHRSTLAPQRWPCNASLQTGEP